MDLTYESQASSLHDKILGPTSLITLGLTQSNSAYAPRNDASRPHIANGPSLSALLKRSNDTPSTTQDKDGPNTEPTHKMPRSDTQPIMIRPNHNQHQARLSPRTTRHNMLFTELTEFLRRHMLWERRGRIPLAHVTLEKREKKREILHNEASLESQ